MALHSALQNTTSHLLGIHLKPCDSFILCKFKASKFQNIKQFVQNSNREILRSFAPNILIVLKLALLISLYLVRKHFKIIVILLGCLV